MSEYDNMTPEQQEQCLKSQKLFFRQYAGKTKPSVARQKRINRVKLQFEQTITISDSEKPTKTINTIIHAATVSPTLINNLGYVFTIGFAHLVGFEICYDRNIPYSGQIQKWMSEFHMDTLEKKSGSLENFNKRLRKISLTLQEYDRNTLEKKVGFPFLAADMYLHAFKEIELRPKPTFKMFFINKINN